jgi:hypothetical protein
VKNSRRSFDGPIDASQSQRVNIDAKCIGRPEVDDKKKSGWLLYWKITGFCAAEDLNNKGRHLTKSTEKARTICDQTTFFRCFQEKPRCASQQIWRPMSKLGQS